MTNKDALISVLGVSVSDNTLEKAMIDKSVVSGDTYTSNDELAIDKCAIPILESLLSEANVSEGGYSISYDRTAIRERLNILLGKLGIKSTAGPAITSKAPW